MIDTISGIIDTVADALVEVFQAIQGSVTGGGEA